MVLNLQLMYQHIFYQIQLVFDISITSDDVVSSKYLLKEGYYSSISTNFLRIVPKSYKKTLKCDYTQRNAVVNCHNWYDANIISNVRRV